MIIFSAFFYDALIILCVIQLHSQQTQNICTAFVQRRLYIFDVGPTLYKCYTNVLCLLGYCYKAAFKMTTVITVPFPSKQLLLFDIACTIRGFNFHPP